MVYFGLVIFVAIGVIFGYGVGRSQGTTFGERVKNFFDLNSPWVK